jgi:hypothetical protein
MDGMMVEASRSAYITVMLPLPAFVILALGLAFKKLENKVRSILQASATLHVFSASLRLRASAFFRIRRETDESP